MGKHLYLRIVSALGFVALALLFVGIDPFLSAADQANGTPAVAVDRTMKGDRLPLIPAASFTPSQANSGVPQSLPQAQMPFACDAAFSTIKVRGSANVYRRCMA